MLNLFSPHGSNPLGNVRLSNPRTAKVDFDRSVKSNVLAMDGDLTQSKMQIPREDRPVASLQLIHPLLCVQLMIPNNGQFLIELSVSHSSVVRMKMTCGTHISKPDVHEVKGVAHVKLPLAIPRNSWTQVVFHVPGIFSHLFGLPSVRWVDTVTIAGSVRLKRILVTSEEQLALESRPAGMLLYTLPAYGPPLWTGKCGVAQPDPKSDSPVESPADAGKVLKTAAGTSTPSKDTGGGGSGSNSSGTPPPASSSPFKMKFVRGEDGQVSFSATNEQMLEEKRRKREQEERAAEEERQRQEQEVDEAARRQKREEEMKKIQEDRRDYVRLMETNVTQAAPTTNRFGGVPVLRKKPLNTENSSGPQQQSLFNGNEELPTGWDSDNEDPIFMGTALTTDQQQPVTKKSAVRDSFTTGGTFSRSGMGPTSTTSSSGGGAGKGSRENQKPIFAKPGMSTSGGVGAGGLTSPSKDLKPKKKTSSSSSARKIKHVSLVQLNLTEEPSVVHPADDYEGPGKLKEKHAPTYGYGVGCMEVIASNSPSDSPSSTPPPQPFQRTQGPTRTPSSRLPTLHKHSDSNDDDEDDDDQEE